MRVNIFELLIWFILFFFKFIEILLEINKVNDYMKKFVMLLKDDKRMR